MPSVKSYGQILKSSSILGGSAGIGMLLVMIRVKFAALLIGSAGIGMISSFTAIQGLFSTVSGLGIQSSAVREIAVAVTDGNEEAIGRSVLTLRRLCWFTGLMGMVVLIALSSVLSNLTFSSIDHTQDVALLGLTILLVNLAGGQRALLQAMRRYAEIAQVNIVSAFFATLSATGFYYLMGLRGIVPSLVSIAAIQLAVTWYFARKIPVLMVELTWRQTFRESSNMLKLGLAFMWNESMLSAVSYLTITLITNEFDLHSVGLYSAAFALSAVSANIVLGAMGVDYFPRLTGVVQNKKEVNRLVNEQTEIALLLAIPGLLATLTFAPWILQIFYSREFLGGLGLLQWFVLGCLGRVIAFPLGYVIPALGKRRWFLFIETSVNIAHLTLIVIGLKWIGIEGVAIAYFVLHLGYVAAVYFVCRHLTDFSWSSDCRKIALYTLPVIALVFVVSRSLPGWPTTLIGSAITFASLVFCLRELARRLGTEHRVVRIIGLIPGAKLLFKFK